MRTWNELMIRCSLPLILLRVALALGAFAGLATQSKAAMIGSNIETVYQAWIASSGLDQWIGPVSVEATPSKTRAILIINKTSPNLLSWYISLRSRMQEDLRVDIQRQLFLKLLQLTGGSLADTEVDLTDGICALSLRWNADQNDVLVSTSDQTCSVVTKLTPVAVEISPQEGQKLSKTLTQTISDFSTKERFDLAVERFLRSNLPKESEISVTHNTPGDALINVENVQNIVIKGGGYWERLSIFAVVTGAPTSSTVTCISQGWYDRGKRKPSPNDYLPMETSPYGTELVEYTNAFCSGLRDYLVAGEK